MIFIQIYSLTALISGFRLELSLEIISSHLVVFILIPDYRHRENCFRIIYRSVFDFINFTFWMETQLTQCRTLHNLFSRAMIYCTVVFRLIYFFTEHLQFKMSFIYL